MYEGEQEGPYNVALNLLGGAIRDEFLKVFPDPEKNIKKAENDPYIAIKAWFAKGNTVEFWYEDSDDEMFDKLMEVDGLHNIVADKANNRAEVIILMEVVLHGLAELNMITREMLDDKISFNDSLADMFDDLLNTDNEDDY